jgi:hypothetical protein
MNFIPNFRYLGVPLVVFLGSNLPAATPWINEFHYDNASTDTNEFVEVFVPTGYADLANLTLTLYNGSGGAPYTPAAPVVSGWTAGTTIAAGSFYSYTFPSNGLQNGAPDGFSLSDTSGVLEFLSYEGSFTAVGGPANGTLSTDIGISQAGTEPVNSSLGRTGTGINAGDFTWAASSGVNTKGDINAGQTINVAGPPPPPGPAPLSSGLVISGQPFDAVGSASPGNPSLTVDQVSTGGFLTNFGASNSDPTRGLTYTSQWIDTRSAGTGPVTLAGDTSDFIGANSFTGAGAPDIGPDGNPYLPGSRYNFEFNDTDGRIDVLFGAVNLAGFDRASLSLDYWINDTGYEADDLFRVSLSDGTTTLDLLNFGETALEANVSPDVIATTWKNLLFDITSSALNTSLPLFLTISVDTNAADENIFVDNVAFIVPEPSRALFGLLGAVFLLRRRRF